MVAFDLGSPHGEWSIGMVWPCACEPREPNQQKRPQQIYAWATSVFGPVATFTDERVKRFVEEAIEVAHSCGLKEHFIETITSRVYDRKRGDTAQEIGQAQMTLECLAESIGLSADIEADREFDRVQSLPKDYFVQRQNEKAAAGIAAKTMDADAAAGG